MAARTANGTPARGRTLWPLVCVLPAALFVGSTVLQGFRGPGADADGGTWAASCRCCGQIAAALAPVAWAEDATDAGGAPEGPGTSRRVTVAGRIDRKQVTIGTPFRYTVNVAAPKDVELIIPVLGGQLGEFSVTDFGEHPIRKDGDRVVVSRWYTLVAYRPGYLLIPGLTVQYRDVGGELQRVDGDDIGITVVSLLEHQADATDIRDIAGPVTVPIDWTPVLVVLGVLAGVVGLGFVAARLLRRINAPAAPPPTRPPHEEALEALARLRHQRLDTPGSRADWYVGLSTIVRIYIERRFSLRAPEMTTEEFIHAVQRDSPLGPAHRDLLGGFLSECDLVKFARHIPDVEAAERAYSAARRFVDETRPQPAAEDSRRAA